MATEKYPQQNTVMPMNKEAVDSARARLGNPPSEWPVEATVPHDGKGSRRQTGPNTWVDDRIINHDDSARALPSADSPPELQKGGRAVPSSFDPTKVYQVEFGKATVHAGRPVAPGKSYMVVGLACTEMQDAILDAVEVGTIPADPDAQPSG